MSWGSGCGLRTGIAVAAMAAAFGCGGDSPTSPGNNGASGSPGPSGATITIANGRVTPSEVTAMWVHCPTGFRSAIAASLLERAGRDVVYIDDDYTNAVSAGLATGWT